ncbi:uromodulin-like [Polyodon spathula]|uniref:uromodulin-like n=1 Tax=Polyodon spathula TaxID=7913 RepID=UPI001B7EBE50|nr:uromodulin-like [Polyodon spathula]
MRNLIILLLIPCISASGTGTFTSCSDCPENTVCRPSSRSAECICAEGFVGDSISCYNSTACNEAMDCCRRGFQWSRDLGCTDIDECALDSDLNTCQPQSSCENTIGSFHCLLDQVNQPGPRSVSFSCLNQPCPSGQDCITAGVSQHCDDPCKNYTVLDEPWRSTNFTLSSSLNAKCDSNLNGWYRFFGKGSVRMPETCVPMYSCGAHAPMWINGKHPLENDGIVSRQSCGHWESNCCNFKTTVHIKACPGNYYVYKFQSTPACQLVYCADFNTTLCSESCSKEEECVISDGVNWKCVCQKNLNYSTEMSSLTPKLVCGSKLIQTGLSKCHMESVGLNSSSVHLLNSSCQGFEDRNENVTMVMAVTGRREGECGTTISSNGSHVTYTNTLHAAHTVVGNVIFNPKADVQFACSYPLDMQTSLHIAINPIVSTLKIAITGLGISTAKMSLYQTPNYTKPYTSEKVSLPIESTLYVGVFVEDIEGDRFAVVLESCYATPSPDPSDPVQFFMIQNRCPNKRGFVTVQENGMSLHGAFSVELFKFVGNYDSVYLHCGVQVCDKTAESCTPGVGCLQWIPLPAQDLQELG